MSQRSFTWQQRGGRGRGRGTRSSGRGRNQYEYSRGASTGRARGRDRYRGRGRGRGRGRAPSGCFICHNEGHYARDCPNNQGRGNRNPRSNDRGRGTSFTGRDPSQRFHEQAAASLLKQIKELNASDVSGVHHVRIIEFTDGLQKVQKLSTGGWYYYVPASPEKPAINSKHIPPEYAGKPRIIRNRREQDQGSRFPKPPPQDQYPRDLKIIPNIVTNSYPVRGDFLDNVVHIYLVEFDKPIGTQDIALRRNTVLGINKKEKQRNQQLLNTKFGYWKYHNHHLLSMGAPAHKQGKNDELKLSETNTVSFRWLDSAVIGGSDLEIVEEEQLLNIFVQKIMNDGGFRRVRDQWYYRNITNPPASLRDIQPTHWPEVTLLHGFKVRMELQQPADRKKDTKSGRLKVGLTNKQVSSKTVHEIISDIAMQKNMDIRSKTFQEAVRKKLNNKFMIMSYNGLSVKICGVDFEKNENWTFSLKSGGKVTVKQYLKKQYGVRTKSKEICVLLDHRENAYLPQFGLLTVRSDEVDPKIRSNILDYNNQPIDKTIQRVHALVKHMNKAAVNRLQTESEDKKENDANQKRKKERELRYGFQLNETCIATNAIALQYPNISIMSYGNRIKTTPLTAFIWGGRDGTKGFLDDVKPLKKWIIVATGNKGNKCIDIIYDTYSAYIKMRGFNTNELPLWEPDDKLINFNNPNSYKSIAQRRYELIFLVIPDGKRGSEIKIKFGKAVQSKHTVNNNGSLIQCICESTVLDRRKSKSAILGAIEQAMGKVGNILYRITPAVQNNSQYKLNKIWTIGLGISHGTNPTVANMTLQTLPFCGTQRGMRNQYWLNTPRKQVVPYVAMVTMTVNALKSVMDRLRDKKKRPGIIMIFRDGAADNMLKEIHSKECVGIQRGIHEVKKELAAKYHIEWKVKIQFIVVSKDPIDRFGVNRNGRIEPLQVPSVIISKITSTKLWDFFIWGFHPKSDYVKPKRYVVLKQEVKQLAPMDMYNIVYSLSYCYHPSVPFIKGGTGSPAPITFARHFAEKAAQMIVAADKNMSQLKCANNLITQPQVVSYLIDIDVEEKTENEMNVKKDVKDRPQKRKMKVKEEEDKKEDVPLQKPSASKRVRI